MIISDLQYIETVDNCEEVQGGKFRSYSPAYNAFAEAFGIANAFGDDYITSFSQTTTLTVPPSPNTPTRQAFSDSRSVSESSSDPIR